MKSLHWKSLVAAVASIGLGIVVGSVDLAAADRSTCMADCKKTESECLVASKCDSAPDKEKCKNDCSKAAKECRQKCPY